MTTAHHPVDSVGLPLPDGSWPDAPGSAGALEPVRRFCNTVNREQGGDAWRSTAELDVWLRREGWRVPAVDERDLNQLVRVRDLLWRSIVERRMDPLAPVLERVELRVGIDDGALRLRAADGGAADRVTASLVATIVAAGFDGSWSRLKACQHCDWVFVDASRNRSGRWCSMSACGGREKARAYRARQRA
ncbi:MAG: CGNR zinc finger domain-containing protein [Acidimicrobiales bacterium]